MSAIWYVCLKGEGYRHDGETISSHLERFPKYSVGYLKEDKGDFLTIMLIGTSEQWDISPDEVEQLDVSMTGDSHEKKICNMCHRLLPTISDFEPNVLQKNNRVVRRPSCRRCRTDIDKRAPKTNQARAMEKNRPEKGSPFRCPICQKRTIAGITARIVADHNHHTGNIRGFICDSCNTGLGRFKNGEDYLENAILYVKQREK